MLHHQIQNAHDQKEVCQNLQKSKKGKTLKQKVSIEFKSMLQFSFAYLSFDYSINNQKHVFPLVSIALQVNFTNCLSIEQLTIFTSTKRGS